MSKVSGLTKNFFLHRLRVYDLVERKVQGDGNCQVSLLCSLESFASHDKF